LGVVPRSMAPEGFLDLNQDDFEETDPMLAWQKLIIHATYTPKVPVTEETSEMKI
jgi:hypothetical protein